MNKIARNTAIAGIAILVTGCASSPGTSTATTTSTGASNNSAVVTRQQEEIESLQRELERTRGELASAQTTSQDTVSADSDLFPPNAQPGECYARILIPASYRTESETVLAKEASSRIEIIPAVYEDVTETLLVKEASTRLEVIPAEYGEVTEQMMVTPEKVSLREIPARYDTVTEQVLDKAAHTVWKRGPASAFSGQNVVSTQTSGTGEVMCLVEVPATYKTVTKTVLVSPARTEEVVTPAEYRTVTKRVVSRPATTREVTIPAEYDTVTVKKMVKPASERVIEIPAEYETVTRQVMTKNAELEWRTVLCEVNMTAGNVRSIQSELSDRGYYKGPRDGIIGPMTLGAANAYARDKGLPAGDNYIAMEVVESLGLDI